MLPAGLLRLSLPRVHEWARRGCWTRLCDLGNLFHLFRNLQFPSQFQPNMFIDIDSLANLCRDILGGMLPVIIRAMFRNLSVKGAGVMLGGIAVALYVISWAIWMFGEKINSRSKLAKCQSLNWY